MSENTVHPVAHVMDYTHCAFVDVRPGREMGPARGGYLGIGVDDDGHVVMGEVLFEDDGLPRFAEASRWSGGPALTRVGPERLEPFLDGGRAAKGMGSFVIAGPQTPQGQAQLRVRGDDLNAALHVLEKPVAWLQPGDAVLVHDVDAQLIAQPQEGTGRHGTQVQEVSGDGMKIDGQWFDASSTRSLRSRQSDELKVAVPPRRSAGTTRTAASTTRSTRSCTCSPRRSRAGRSLAKHPRRRSTSTPTSPATTSCRRSTPSRSTSASRGISTAPRSSSHGAATTSAATSSRLRPSRAPSSSPSSRAQPRRPGAHSRAGHLLPVGRVDPSPHRSSRSCRTSPRSEFCGPAAAAGPAWVVSAP